MNLHEALMAAMADDQVDAALALIRSGLDLNFRCDQGASALHGAILLGNQSIVREMLEHGADPNLIADEPAAYIYAEKPLELAAQCRFLMDWDKYDPIVKLLKRFGATNSEGRVNPPDDEEVHRRAREWQSHRLA